MYDYKNISPRLAEILLVNHPSVDRQIIYSLYFANAERIPYETLRKGVKSELKKSNVEISYSQFSDAIDGLEKDKIISVEERPFLIGLMPSVSEQVRIVSRLNSHIKSQLDVEIVKFMEAQIST